MPSPEGESRPQPPENQPETEPVPYHRTVRYSEERPSRRAYSQAQDLLYNNPDCDLSAYRFLFQQRWHVSVLGEPPAEELDQQLHNVLRWGNSVTLPSEILKSLAERREESIKQAPWVERHYRPGQNL